MGTANMYNKIYSVKQQRKKNTFLWNIENHCIREEKKSQNILIETVSN